MSTLQIFAVQAAISTVVFILIAWWYVAPRLAVESLRVSLIPLLLPHTLRGMGLLFVVPTVTDPTLPRDFAVPAAYGDLLSALLALIAVIALRTGWKWAFGLVWLFNLVGTADLLYDILQGVLVNIPRYQLGVVWLIPTFIVPALLVIHGLVFIMLVRRRGEYRSIR